MNVKLESDFDRVFDTQRTYRLLLEACARPGKLLQLPEVSLEPPSGFTAFAAAIAFTLCDQETTFALLPQDPGVTEYLYLNTGARPVSVDQAGFVFGQAAAELAGLQLVRRGDLLSPEEGATLVMLVASVMPCGPGEILIALSGPGVDGQRRFAVNGLALANLARVKELNEEFPLGVDAFIIDGQGRLAAIPRSAAITWEAA